MSEILAHMFRHHLWANMGILDACDGLAYEVLDAKDEGTYGSIRDTLVHLFAAEERYLASIAEYAPKPPLAEGTFPGLVGLRERGRVSGEAFLALAGKEKGDRVISGTHPRFGKFAIPVSTFFAQPINHATEHRAHVCTILTQQGVEPPALDRVDVPGGGWWWG